MYNRPLLLLLLLFCFSSKRKCRSIFEKKISCEKQGVDGIKNLIFISRKQNSGENLIKNNLHENFQVEKIFCSLAFPKGAARRMWTIVYKQRKKLQRKTRSDSGVMTRHTLIHEIKMEWETEIEEQWLEEGGGQRNYTGWVCMDVILEFYFPIFNNSHFDDEEAIRHHQSFFSLSWFARVTRGNTTFRRKDLLEMRVRLGGEQIKTNSNFEKKNGEEREQQMGYNKTANNMVSFSSRRENKKERKSTPEQRDRKSRRNPNLPCKNKWENHNLDWKKKKKKVHDRIWQFPLSFCIRSSSSCYYHVSVSSCSKYFVSLVVLSRHLFLLPPSPLLLCKANFFFTLREW